MLTCLILLQQNNKNRNKPDGSLKRYLYSIPVKDCWKCSRKTSHYTQIESNNAKTLQITSLKYKISVRVFNTASLKKKKNPSGTILTKNIAATYNLNLKN